METHLRSWTKSISWRVLGIIILIVISYGFTRDLKQTTWITLIFHSIRLVLYYFHERMWNKISWGKIGYVFSENNKTKKEKR